MALPTILVNSSTGSDSQASGAGPTTAVFGTGASLNSTTSVNLSADSPDLSGVATDGSACLWVSTSSGRQFSRITAVNNGTKIVTVATTYSVTESGRTWAIGGKRASIGSTSSRILFERASSTGDIEAGWIVEMESGHTETIASTYNIQCSGDRTNGPIILQGTPNAATMPIITFSNNGNAIAWVTSLSYVHFKNFELRNSNASKTASVGFSISGSYNLQGLIIENIVCSHATNKFWKFMNVTSSSNFLGTSIINCIIKNCANRGIDFQSSGQPDRIIGNIIKGCGSDGLFMNQCDELHVIENNIFAGNSGAGARLRYRQGIFIKNNTFDANTSHGLYLELDPEQARYFTLICNNIFSNNGAYGLNMFDGATQQVVNVHSRRQNNCYYNNTSGKINLSSLTTEDGEVVANPSYTNTSSDDYTPTNSALLEVGWPTLGDTNKIAIGAVQPGNTSSGGVVAGNIRGGFVN